MEIDRDVDHGSDGLPQTGTALHRRVANRYDKTAESFLGFIDITSIRLRLRHLPT